MKKQSPRSIRRSYEFENRLRGALLLTPELSARPRGWFPKLLIIVLSYYIDHKTGKL